MNGLNVLPLRAGASPGAKAFPGSQGSVESAGSDFAALLLNLIANRRQGEGQTGEDRDLHALLMGYPFLMGLEGPGLHNPAGKEANSGAIAGQAGGAAQNALAFLNALTASPLGEQWLWLLAQESLSSGMIQAGSGTGDMPHSELDQYRSEIIKLLQELNGKLEVVARPANAQAMQAAAAARAFQAALGIASEAQVLANPAMDLEQNHAVLQQVNRLPAAQPANQANTVLNQAAGDQALQQPVNNQAVTSGLEGRSSSPGHAPAVNAAFAQHINGSEQGLNRDQGSSFDGGKNESLSQNIAHQGAAAGESVDFKAIDVKHGEKGSAPSLLQQIVQALHKQADLVEMSRRRLPHVERVEIQLHPAELGKIYVSVRLEDGQVHLFMQATESSTTSLLQQQLGDLRQTLTDLGVACGRFEMGQGNGREQQGFEDRAHHRPELLNYAEPVVDEALSEMGYFGVEDKGSQINLTA